MEEGGYNLTVVKHQGTKCKVKNHNEKKKQQPSPKNPKCPISFFRVLNSVLSPAIRYP